jgi:hypothetical protein
MPEIDVADATWIAVRPSVLAPLVADPGNWRVWWPELDLAVAEDRGSKGMRWTVRADRAGRVTGSMEVWLEAADDGTVAHFFLRLDGQPGPVRRRERARLERVYRTRAKRIFWAMSDRLDPGRWGRVAAPSSRSL